MDEGVAAVDREVLQAHLVNAERYIDKGAQEIGRLREIIDVLGRGGADTAAATDLLRNVEKTQEWYVSHREWVLQELKNSTANRLLAPFQRDPP